MVFNKEEGFTMDLPSLYWFALSYLMKKQWPFLSFLPTHFLPWQITFPCIKRKEVVPFFLNRLLCLYCTIFLISLVDWTTAQKVRKKMNSAKGSWFGVKFRAVNKKIGRVLPTQIFVRLDSPYVDLLMGYVTIEMAYLWSAMSVIQVAHSYNSENTQLKMQKSWLCP